MEHGAWSSMEHGAWSMEQGAWSMERGAKDEVLSFELTSLTYSVKIRKCEVLGFE